MKKRYNEEQIIRILREAETTDVAIRELCRRHNITEQTVFRWRNKYGGMEGWEVGKKRLYRIYCEEGLGLKRKRPWRHVSAVHRAERRPADRANDVWGMDFVVDQLADGRRFRALTVVDLFTRECLAIEIGQSLRAGHVVQALNRLKYDRGPPTSDPL